jgi:phosphoglycerate dehydrogenase-like enzyme
VSADDRPVLLHARWPPVTSHLLTDEHHARLEAVCRVPTRDPVDVKADGEADVETAALLAEVEILFTSWGAPRLGATALGRMSRLRYVAHAAGTVRDLLTDHVWERGIRLSSAAAANAVPVAEFTVAAILFSNKQVFRLQQHYRAHRGWQLWDDVAPGLGNHSKRVGIVGASRIGRRVIELLRPYDLEVVVSDPFLTADGARELGVAALDLDVLLATSDVVSLHAPSLPETQQLLDGRRLGLLRDGATLVNTARGALVDTEALTRELVTGRIDAVLDVTEPEILPEDSPLYELPNVFLTPHIAGSQGTETRRMADLAVAEVERFVAGRPLEHEVTRADLDRIA